MWVVLAISTLRPAEASPLSSQQRVHPLTLVQRLVLPATDVQAELAADQAHGMATPVRFAVAHAVSITPSNGGTWENVPGGRLWRLRLVSAEATDLNLGFTTFWLPEGATLHIISENESFFQGPYTAEDNRDYYQLWTPVVPGDAAVVELFVPTEAKDEPRLVLGHIGAGYRDWFKRKALAQPKAEGSCNNDVVCPQGVPWADQIRSVAVYSVGGSWACTGTLITDTAGDLRPFFLTANHCEVTAANAASVVVYWNYQSATCGTHGPGSLAQSQSGAIFRAAKADVDFTLLELAASPNPGFHVYYSGWDRSGNAPAGAVGIHHPDCDVKAISFASKPLTTVNSCIGSGTSTHWQVLWDSGVTEPGSSGSGIWNPANHLLVGTLSGGDSACSSPSDPDCYGKFSIAWASGSSAASRLRDWLDPQGTSPLTVPGVDSLQYVTFITKAGAVLLAESFSPTNGVVEPGETVTVNFGLQNLGGIAATNLVATLLPSNGVTQVSSPQTYGVLPGGGAIVWRTFTFTASGTCGATITPVLQLQDGAQNLGTVSFSFVLGVPSSLLVFSQDFDAVTAPALPAGWTSSLSGAGKTWVTTTASANTQPNSVFAPNADNISDEQLTSPSIALSNAVTQLSFRHSYDLEDGYDGGVLEISLQGGAFTDILTAGGSFVQNGYNYEIDTDYGNPLAGRSAWSGYSGGFITTTVNLPPAAANGDVRLRWRLGSDDSTAFIGWYVDSITIYATLYACGEPPVRPLIVNPRLMGNKPGLLVRHRGWADLHRRGGQPTHHHLDAAANQRGQWFAALLYECDRWSSPAILSPKDQVSNRVLPEV
jgi:hypothetical protein